MDTPKSNAITLVHGTFAEKEDDRLWTLDGSETQRILTEGLKPYSVRWRRSFAWDGKNSHTSRVDEGVRLARELLDLPQGDASERHILIGHSHGGNVILYALKELEKHAERKCVDGVVCLATPHITVRERSLQPTFVALGFFVGFVVASIYAVAITVPLYEKGIEVGGVWGALFLVGFFLALVIPWIYIAGPLHQRLHKIAVRKAAQLRTPELDPRFRGLSVGITGDEAYWWLSHLRVAAGVANPLWERAIQFAGKSAIALLAASAAAMLLAQLYNMIPFVDNIDIDGYLDLWGEVVGHGGVVALLVLVSILAVAWALPFVLRSHRAGFGWETTVTRSFLDIGVQSHGPQRCSEWNYHHFSPRDVGLDEAALPSLRSRLHGLAHDHPVVLDHVAVWIKRNV